MLGFTVVVDGSRSRGLGAEAERCLAGAPYRVGQNIRGLEASGIGVAVSGPETFNSLFHDARRDVLVLVSGGLFFSDGTRADAQAIAERVAWHAAVIEQVDGEGVVLVALPARKKLWIRRDDFGVAPVFFSSTGTRRIIASDIEQLLPSRDQWQIDPRAIYDGLTYDFRSPAHTPFVGITRLLAGQTLELNGPLERRSVSIDRPIPPSSESDVERAFALAVERRVDSKHPTAAQLSGGLDSSSIVVTAQKRGVIVPLAGRFSGLACDEGRYIDAVENTLSVAVERYDASGFRPDDLDDTQLAQPWQIAQRGANQRGFRIAKQKGARIVLGGMGGDELFFEQGLFTELARSRDVLTWIDELRRLRGSPRALDTALRESARGLLPSLVLARRRRAGRVPEWLGPKLRSIASSDRSPEAPVYTLGDHTRRSVHGFATQHRLELLELEVARAGLVPRLPFYDRKLVRAVLGLPRTARLRRGGYKTLLRRIMPGLPALVRDRTEVTEFTPNLERCWQQSKEHLGERLSGAWLAEPWVPRTAALGLFHSLDGSPFDPMGFCQLWDITQLDAWLARLEARELVATENER